MPAHVEIDDGRKRIVLYVDYYAGIGSDCKSIVGYKFNPDDKVWTYPLRMQTCHALRKTFGPEMTIGPNLQRWAMRNGALYRRQRLLAQKPDGALAKVRERYPAFWEAMASRPYQRSGAEFLAATMHCADFSEPGLGKTATSLAALIQGGVWEGRHLVVVSNKTAIRSTWRREIHKWCPDAKVYAMPDGRVAREKALDQFWDDRDGPRFVVCLPHMLQIKLGHYCKKCNIWQEDAANERLVGIEIPMEHYADSHNWTQKDYKMDWPEFFENEKGRPFVWDSIIADECHDYLLKARPGQANNQPQWAIGMRRLRSNAKIAITGTPLRGKEQNVFGILHWLDPKRFSSFWGWAGAYFDISQNQYNQTVQGLRPEMAEAFYDLVDSLCLRRTKREVRKELPPQLPIEHWVPLEGEHERQYVEFETNGIAQLESGVVEGLGTLSELTRMRQLAFGPWDIKESNMSPIVSKSPKIQLLMEMLRERGAFSGQGPKYIIASQYVKIIDALDAHILATERVRALKITGAVSAAQRDNAVNSFSSNSGPRILLLNTKAGGSSLTLDAQCDEMFILDETWVHDDQVQLMGRIDNRGQRIVTRMYHFFRTERTIDEGIAIKNDDQNSMQSRILDRRDGNQIALSLLKRGI